MKFFSGFFSKILVLILFFACVFPVFSQQSRSFPEGSSQGNTEIGRNIRPLDVPNISVQITEPRSGEEVAFSVRLLLILTVLTIAPSLLLLVTCFLRFSIVLDFIKRALSLQQVPPTAVLNGIAFFMTVFVMWPTFTEIYTKSYKPMADGNISIEAAIKGAEVPVKSFMYSQMKGDESYIMMFMNMAKLEKPSESVTEIPFYVMVPAFILHELTVAFKIGVILYIPFIIIDMVVASILMSMGMMMLPPVQISMPFKLMLFVLVDGWGLLTTQLFASVLH
ncbi:MAG: flagellar type III secretion system pore protein FliP [Treponema sp.]